MLSELGKLLEDNDNKPLPDKMEILVNMLKKHELEFYYKVLKSETPNFLITSYYSLYLRFLEILDSEIRKNEITESEMIVLDRLINLFGKPILIYLRKKEVIPNISELASMLIHVIINFKLENRLNPHEILQIITLLDKTST